jgi:hypothetical protein
MNECNGTGFSKYIYDIMIHYYTFVIVLILQVLINMYIIYIKLTVMYFICVIYAL